MKRQKSRHMAADTLQIKILSIGLSSAEFIGAIRLFNAIMDFEDAAGLQVSGVFNLKTFYANDDKREICHQIYDVGKLIFSFVCPNLSAMVKYVKNPTKC